MLLTSLQFALCAWLLALFLLPAHVSQHPSSAQYSEETLGQKVGSSVKETGGADSDETVTKKKCILKCTIYFI